MSGIDQEIWQDFVVEAEENMQELEPNLLLLEQDPENTSLLNDCFRNMHSIKGAANYMGLEKTATVAHRMESLFDNVRQGNIVLDENALNALFDGLDKVKQLVREVSENREEKSGIEDIVQELEAVISGKGTDADPATSAEDPQAVIHSAGDAKTAEEVDDDAELLAIFTEELRSRMEQLEKLTPPVERGVVEEILQDMIRVTNYIGIEELLSGLESEAASFIGQTADSSSLVTKDEIDSVLTQLKALFATHLSSDFANIEPDNHEGITLAGEEDEELYRIFLEFVQEEGRPLANIPDQPDSSWLEACRQAVERLTASAHYMDYHDVVSLLEEWDERLVEALSCVTDERPFNGEPLRRLWARFCAMLPGLENCLAPLEEVTAQKDQTAEDSQPGTEARNTDQSSVHEDALPGSEPDTAGMTTGVTDQDDSFQGLDSALDSMFDGALPDDIEADTNINIHGSDNEGTDAAPVPHEEDDIAPHIENITGSYAREPVQDTVIPEPAPVSISSQKGDAPKGIIPGNNAEIPNKPSNTKLVRVDLTKVEALLEDVGELVVLRAAMLQIADDMKELYARWLDDRRMTSPELKPFKHIMIRTAEQTATLEKVVHQLQDGVMKMRMLPVGTLFRRYPRMIRDLSHKLNKKVELRIYGEGTALDKRVIEHITDPLQHIIRNAVDHGIEAPDVRERQGKPGTGVITLSAGQEGNFVILTISDDGRGLDREAIIQKAISNGVIGGDTARTMSDERVWNMIFLPGISTASSISETSGRGVGMDVVKNNIERLGGQITVNSSPGRGTSITLRIPLTLAIIQTLLVRVGEQNMAIPLSAVQETFRIYEQDVSSIEGFEIISLRQETLPLIRLGRIFRGTGAEENPEKLFVVRVRMQGMEAGLAVDRFIGQQEVVIKPLADYLTDEPGFSGATILGDGTVALILDIPAVLERARNFTLKRQQIMEQAALGLNVGEASPVFH